MKRFISFLLVCAIVCSVLPKQVYALEKSEPSFSIQAVESTFPSDFEYQEKISDNEGNALVVKFDIDCSSVYHWRCNDKGNCCGTRQ